MFSALLWQEMTTSLNTGRIAFTLSFKLLINDAQQFVIFFWFNEA